MTADEKQKLEQWGLQLTELIAGGIGHLHALAAVDPTRALQIAGLIREELDKLPQGN